MTRGNFVLITNTANWMSIQFNGDMYPSCNGKFVYHMLESVETYDDLAAAILKFDEGTERILRGRRIIMRALVPNPARPVKHHF